MLVTLRVSRVNYLLVTSIENLVSNNHYSVVLAISWLHIPTLQKGEYAKANQRLMRKKRMTSFFILTKTVTFVST